MSSSRDIRRRVFAYRSYTPIPFLLLMVWYAEPTPTSMIAGGMLIALGEAVRFWGVSIAGSETRTTGNVGGTYLITNGPFAHVRNPLYLGNMLLYAGVGLMSLALFPWLFLVALAWFYVQYYLIVTREEEYLAAAFGAAYDEYCAVVHRFLPRLSPYRGSRPPEKTLNLSEGLRSERRTLQAIGLVVLVIVVIFFVRRNGA
jgi:protein-S-isoprenylcysteine O-methyltransferase Ste14